jgi:ATP-binding cassette subfamily C protein
MTPTTTDPLDPTRDPAAPLPVATPAEVRAELLARVRRAPALPALALLLVVAGVVSGLVIPWTLGRIVDVVTGAAPRVPAVTGPVLLVAAAGLAQAVLTGWGNALVARGGEEIVADVRERAFGQALSVPLERLERTRTGDLVSRVSGDVAVLSEAVRALVPQLADAVLQIGLTLAALLLLDWRFALAALLAVPLQAHAVRWLLRTSRPVRQAERTAQSELAQTVLESVDGAHTVRAFRLVPHRTALAAGRSAATRDLALLSTRLGTRFFGKLNAAEWTGLSALLAVGYLLVRSGHAEVGTASAAALYFARLFGPINALLSSFDDVQSAGAAASRVVGLVRLPATDDEANPERPAPPGGTVELRGVGHAYVPGHPVLADIEVTLAAGERVAVVGASGAGKSTLARLVAGVHRPTTGRVLLGGRPLDELTPGQIRRSVALVSQETHVFAGTLAADLRLARPEATDPELRAALAEVRALPWVDGLPDGLETRVGRGGLRLTPVQAQHLALARLVLADPPIAVLDEATAEAGSAGSRVLEAAAERALAGRTAIIVAHRLTQAIRADRVLLLAHGHVLEQGTHDDLVSAGGRYAALWQAWSGARV